MSGWAGIVADFSTWLKIGWLLWLAWALVQAAWYRTARLVRFDVASAGHREVEETHRAIVMRKAEVMPAQPADMLPLAVDPVWDPRDLGPSVIEPSAADIAAIAATPIEQTVTLPRLTRQQRRAEARRIAQGLVSAGSI